MTAVPARLVFIVNSSIQAVTILETVQEFTNLVQSRFVPEILFLSPPNAVLYAGPTWWHSLIKITAEQGPAVRFYSILDCATSVGYALAAIADGQKWIAITLTEPAILALSEIAAYHNTKITPINDLQQLGPHLDLTDQTRPVAVSDQQACLNFLQQIFMPVPLKSNFL